MRQESTFYWDVIQGTEDWHKLRAGKITGSVASTFLVNGKGENGFGTGAFTEFYRILEERLTNEPRESFKGNRATEIGHENEPIAIEAYEQENFISVTPVGFVSRDINTGASPDGLMPEIRKGLEVKCLPVEHMRVQQTKTHDKKHEIQCQWNLWCSGYDSWDLYYWHPKLKSYKISFLPDLKLFEKFEERSKTFIEMVNKALNEY